MQSHSPRRPKQTHGKAPLQSRKASLLRTNMGVATAFLLFVTAALWLGLSMSQPAPALTPHPAARRPQPPPDMTGLQEALSHASVPQPANPLISLVRSDGYSEADTQRMVAQATPTAPTTSVTTDYVYDGQNMVREMQRGTDGQLHPTATYLTGPRGPEYRRDDKTGQVRWYVYDGLGSVVGELDPSGNFTTGAKYDVYGAVRGRTGTATTAHGFVGRLGHLSEPETGLIYMRGRYYDPTVGRFVSEDPARRHANWFSYCHNDPINYFDPTGKDETLGELSVGSEGAAESEGSSDATDLSALQENLRPQSLNGVTNYGRQSIAEHFEESFGREMTQSDLEDLIAQWNPSKAEFSEEHSRWQCVVNFRNRLYRLVAEDDELHNAFSVPRR